MTDNTDLAIDPDEVVFDENGRVESMTDPDSGEKIVADPLEEEPQATGPYDDLNREGEENTRTEEQPPVVTADEQLVLDMVSAYGFEDEDGNPTDAIEWNGEQTRVRDLSPEDRREFFEQLRETDRAEAAGNSAEEQQLLDFLRGGGDLRQALGLQPGDESQLAGLDADGLNRLDIRQQYPSLSEEEVEAELEHRKGSSLYDKKTGSLRERLTAQEQADAQDAANDSFKQEKQLFETAAGSMKDVLGFPIKPEVREYMLSQSATQAENGQSPFLNSLTPEKILRLQFLDTYADSIKEHYEGEIQKAYTRGKREALQGAPTTPPGRGGAGTRTAGAAGTPANVSDYTLGED